MKKLSIGILAHVDAGKTTLTESILFITKTIRKQGRVDNGDAFLDTEALEKKRGVTIYSKQAVVTLSKEDPLDQSNEDIRLTFIDTPGHSDLVGEAERAMSVMDLAVLMISAPDGITDSARNLSYMLDTYKVPYIIYVNKTDMPDISKDHLLAELRKEFGPSALAYEEPLEDIMEDIASLSEDTIEKYLNDLSLSEKDISTLIYTGRFHPVLFGAAIRNEGTEDLIKLITRYAPDILYRDDTSAKIFKITYEDGHKLCFAKITGGSISVRESLPDERIKDQKITQLRRYSGGRYETLQSAEAGDVITLCGIEDAFCGMGIGLEPDDSALLSRPVLRYELLINDDTPVRTFIPKIRELAYEDPLLKLDTGVNGDKIHISVMGDFQLEILVTTIEQRFGVKVSLDQGSIIYKETITSPVIGYGHFEPLKHYAEVQLLMEPLPEGSGIELASAIGVNDLALNWQKTIMSSLVKDLPSGVLTGSALTDMRLTLIGGKAHIKHTDSQDFREASRRAVRQGLMKTESTLLEPYYEYTITLPAAYLGRVMNDMSLIKGEASIKEQDEISATITGTAPAKGLINYQSELTKYTSGKGRISVSFYGYKACDDEEIPGILESISYDPDRDQANVSGSIFTEHGAGRYFPWDECESMMHLALREDDFFDTDTETDDERIKREAEKARKSGSLSSRLDSIGTDEIDEILRRATHANAGKQSSARKWHYRRTDKSPGSFANSSGSGQTTGRAGHASPVKIKPRYLLVDGYNIINAWDELKQYLTDSTVGLDSAKYKLLDILSEYRVIKDTEVIVVFDAYKAKGHLTEKIDYMGVHVVYTKEAETADQYIARFTLQNARSLDITVATSDGMVQLIIRSADTRLMSARDLYEDVRAAKAGLKDLI